MSAIQSGLVTAILFFDVAEEVAPLVLDGAAVRAWASITEDRTSPTS